MIHIYIDESGGISNNSNVFIMGCIKTMSPNSIIDELNLVRDEIKSTLYFNPIKSDFENQGFHATENHPDIKTKLYTILPLLNYRAYFVILNKKDDFYLQMRNMKTDEEIYKYCLKELLTDRLVSNKIHDIEIVCETITLSKKPIEKTINEAISEIKSSFNSIFIRVEDKSNQILSLIDYLNYILYSILKDTSKLQQRMNFNFELIKPKIGSIKILNNSTYLSRHNEYNINELIKKYNG